MIKRYPGRPPRPACSGTRSSFRPLVSRFTGPYGAFHLRAPNRPILMVAGGSGMAPVLGVLRQLAAERLRAADPLLLRRPRGARPVRPGRDRRPGRAAARLPLHPGHRALRARGDRRGADATPTSTCAGRRRCSRRCEAMLTGRGVDAPRIFSGQVHHLGRRAGRRPRPPPSRAPRRYPSASSPGLRPPARRADALRGRHGRHPALDPPSPDPRLAGVLRRWPRHLERRLDRPALQRLVRLPRSRPAVGAAPSTSRAPRPSSRSRARCAPPPSRA